MLSSKANTQSNNGYTRKIAASKENQPKIRVYAPFMHAPSEMSTMSNITHDDGNIDTEFFSLKSILNEKHKQQEVEEDVPMEDCDIKEQDNPQYVSEYAPAIFKYLRQNEVRYYVETFV